MNILRISHFFLRNFRNHNVIEIVPSFAPNIIALIDKNGSGKTNILEAISLFSPGNGIRNSDLSLIPKNNSGEFFVSIKLSDSQNIERKIDIIYENNKKKILIDNKAIKSQIELRKILDIIWLTPEMQLQISTDSSFRRKFFDRIVFNFFSDHADLIINYEKLVKERMKILEMESNVKSNTWLDSIEKQIASVTRKITENRLNSINKIKSSIEKEVLDIEINLKCKTLHADEDSSIEKELLESREKDKRQFRTSFGCHRYELEIVYKKKNSDLSICSSGEKKYTIISLLFSIADSLIQFNQRTPIILLDEFTSFIDKDFKIDLLNRLSSLGCQTWLTGTEIQNVNHNFLEYSILQVSKDI